MIEEKVHSSEHYTIKLKKSLTRLFISSCLVTLISLPIVIYSLVAFKGNDKISVYSEEIDTEGTAILSDVDVLSEEDRQLILYNEINQYRSENNLFSFKIHSALELSSKEKAIDMLTQDYWSHHDNEGVFSWHFFRESDYMYSVAGENLAIGFTSPEKVLSAWKESKTHNDILLSKNFSDMGASFTCGLDFTDRQNVCLIVLHVGNTN